MEYVQFSIDWLKHTRVSHKLSKKVGNDISSLFPKDNWDLRFSVSKFALPSLPVPTLSLSSAFANECLPTCLDFKKLTQSHLWNIVCFPLLVQHLRTNWYLKILITTLPGLQGSVSFNVDGSLLFQFSHLVWLVTFFERACSKSSSLEIKERWILGITLSLACWVSWPSYLTFLCFNSFLRQRKMIISICYIICFKKKGRKQNICNVLHTIFNCMFFKKKMAYGFNWL